MKIDLRKMINEQDLKVISIDNENKTFICSDGNEYPLECEMSIDELQTNLDKAKIIMKEILSQDGEIDEP